jgi:hypothetical protein
VVGYEACVLVTEQPSLGIHGPGRDNCVGGSVCDGVRLEAEPNVKDHPSPTYLFLFRLEYYENNLPNHL